MNVVNNHFGRTDVFFSLIALVFFSQSPDGMKSAVRFVEHMSF